MQDKTVIEASMKITQRYHLSKVVCWATQDLVGIICTQPEILILYLFLVFFTDHFSLQHDDLGLMGTPCLEELRAGTEHSFALVEGDSCPAPKDRADFWFTAMY